MFFVILLLNISQFVLAAVYNRMYGWSNLLGTYPLMRDAPLEPKPRRG